MNQFKYYHNILEKSRFVNTDKRESQFKNTIDRFFNDWKKQVIVNLKKEVNTGEVKKALGDYNLSSIVFLTASKIKSFITKLAALSTGAAKSGLERSYKDMDVAISWDIDMSKIADLYKSKYQRWFSEVVEKEVQKNVIEEISEGIRDGESIDDIAKRIVEYFEHPITVPEKRDEEGNVARKAYQINQKAYSEMLARTEVSGAVNNGRLEGYRESKLVKTVKWFANPGACPYCEDENGQIYEVGEANDKIPAHPNCRCTWIAEEYGTYKEAEDPTIFSTADQIYSNPNGVGFTEWFKLDSAQEKQVKDLLDQDKYKEAIDLMNRFLGRSK